MFFAYPPPPPSNSPYDSLKYRVIFNFNSVNFTGVTGDSFYDSPYHLALKVKISSPWYDKECRKP